jgi:large-conductance mechanosensitive channel
MMSFLLDEGVITVGTLSGLFTTALLNSLKRNIIDPSIERLAPSHKLDKKKSDEKFSDLFPIPGGTPETTDPDSTIIRWQTFLKDLITWMVIMFLLYLFWKFVLHPNKISKMSRMPNFGKK